MSVASTAVRGLAAWVQRGSFAHAGRQGARLGRLLYRLDRRHRRVAMANLAVAFPDREVSWHANVARGSFAQAGRTILEMLWAGGLDRRRLERAIDPKGFERLREHLGEGRGAIMSSGHFGNWELIGVAFGLLGIPCVSVARPLDDPDLDRLLSRYRTRTGSEVIPKRDALRGALRALRAGKAVAILMDQNTQRHEAVFVPYFGRAAATPPGAAHLHLRTGAPVLPTFAVPTDGRYRLEVGDPVRVDPDAAREEAVYQITAAVTAEIERHVRACPEAWLWMHDRWRERPAANDRCGAAS